VNDSLRGAVIFILPVALFMACGDPFSSDDCMETRTCPLPAGSGNGAGGEAGSDGAPSDATNGGAGNDAGETSQLGGASVMVAGQGGMVGEGGQHPVTSCDLSAPFGKPSLLFDSNETKRSGARFWPDERSIYFATGGELYRSIRASNIVSFGPGEPLKNVNTANHELSPILSRDGLTLYFDGSSVGLLQLAKRAGVNADFENPTDLAGLEAYPAAPYLAGDDDVLYYDAFDGSMSSRHIWRAEITEFGFSESKIVVKQSLNFSPTSPVVGRHELTMYLAVSEGMGTDIYETHRESVDDSFPMPTKVNELSTDVDDAPTWLSEDGCRVIVVAAQNPYLAMKPR
jgi:hypothetical protein